jgi:hypothetical protein
MNYSRNLPKFRRPRRANTAVRASASPSAALRSNDGRRHHGRGRAWPRIDFTIRLPETAYKTSRVVGFEEEVGGRSFRVYPDRRWVNPVADGTPSNPGGALDLSWNRVNGRYLDLDTRIWFFTDYYSISPGMISQIPGKGAKYMVGFTDSTGKPLSPATNYRLSPARTSREPMRPWLPAMPSSGRGPWSTSTVDGQRFRSCPNR